MRVKRRGGGWEPQVIEMRANGLDGIGVNRFFAGERQARSDGNLNNSRRPLAYARDSVRRWVKSAVNW